MVIGHYAVAFASKRAAPRTSLGTLIAAATLLDLLWPIFLLLGWEHVHINPGNTTTPLDFVDYPISHSLLAAVGWGVLLALGYWAITRYRTGAFVVGALVVSHWVLDAIVHRPDLPLYPGSATYVGLSVWNSLAATVAIEGVMFAIGVWMYVAATRARDGVGRYALWAFVLFALVIYASNFASPPPASTRALAWFAMTAWLLPLWTWWADRHRTVDDKRELASASMR